MIRVVHHDRTAPAQADQAGDLRGRPVPAPAEEVVTFHDGSGWTYAVSAEPPTGHCFEERGPAIAAGRYLAKELGLKHVIKNRDGTVCELHSYESECACHRKQDG